MQVKSASLQNDSEILGLAREIRKSLPVTLENDVDGFLQMVIRGQSPSLEGHFEELYAVYAPIRDLIHKKYGEKIRLYRAETKGAHSFERKFLSWAPNPALAAEFATSKNKQVLEADVLVSDVVAVLAATKGSYYVEYLVRDRKAYHDTGFSVPLKGTITILQVSMDYSTKAVEEEVKKVGGFILHVARNEEQETIFISVVLPATVPVDEDDSTMLGPFLVEGLEPYVKGYKPKTAAFESEDSQQALETVLVGVGLILAQNVISTNSFFNEAEIRKYIRLRQTFHPLFVRSCKDLAIELLDTPFHVVSSELSQIGGLNAAQMPHALIRFGRLLQSLGRVNPKQFLQMTFPVSSNHLLRLFRMARAFLRLTSLEERQEYYRLGEDFNVVLKDLIQTKSTPGAFKTLFRKVLVLGLGSTGDVFSTETNPGKWFDLPPETRVVIRTQVTQAKQLQQSAVDVEDPEARREAYRQATQELMDAQVQAGVHVNLITQEDRVPLDQVLRQEAPLQRDGLVDFVVSHFVEDTEKGMHTYPDYYKRLPKREWGKLKTQLRAAKTFDTIQRVIQEATEKGILERASLEDIQKTIAHVQQNVAVQKGIPLVPLSWKPLSIEEFSQAHDVGEVSFAEDFPKEKQPEILGRVSRAFSDLEMIYGQGFEGKHVEKLGIRFGSPSGFSALAAYFQWDDKSRWQPRITMGHEYEGHLAHELSHYIDDQIAYRIDKVVLGAPEWASYGGKSHGPGTLFVNNGVPLHTVLKMHQEGVAEGRKWSGALEAEFPEFQEWMKAVTASPAYAKWQDWIGSALETVLPRAIARVTGKELYAKENEQYLYVKFRSELPPEIAKEAVEMYSHAMLGVKSTEPVILSDVGEKQVTILPEWETELIFTRLVKDSKDSGDLYKAIRQGLVTTEFTKEGGDPRQLTYMESGIEVWARMCEQYAYTRLADVGIVNPWLTEATYEGDPKFMDQKYFETNIAPIMDRLFDHFKKRGVLAKRITARFLEPRCKKCGADESSKLLPILDPLFNFREIAKQMLLLEDHLFHPGKRCSDCIFKHMLTIEAFAEEAVTLDTEGNYIGAATTIAEGMRALHQDFKNGVSPPEAIAQRIRGVRKQVMDAVGNLKLVKTAFHIRKDRDYLICFPEDQTLYVDVPDFASLRNLLLNQRFRGHAHLRTAAGRTPYYGGGIAFKLAPLLLHGVRPVWYLREQGDRETAITQLLEDGIFESEIEAVMRYEPSSYVKECEWVGPPGMRFDLSWVDYIWLGVSNRLRPTPEELARLQEIMPALDIRDRDSDKTGAVDRIAARFKKKKEVPKADGKGTTTVYEYSDRQISRRNNEKAKRIENLRHNIDDLRKQVKKDLDSKDPKTKLTALAIALIDETFERVGNEASAKNGHFGVTGWLLRHLTLGKNSATLKYVGKSGVKHEKVVGDKKVLSILRELTKDKGDNDQVLCQGDECKITAQDVNSYLKDFDPTLTAKDLRGYHANATMQERLKNIRNEAGKLPEEKKEREQQLKDEFKEALEGTANDVGHESSTLKNQYLSPGLEEDYLKDGTVSDSFVKKASPRLSSINREILQLERALPKENDPEKQKGMRQSKLASSGLNSEAKAYLLSNMPGLKKLTVKLTPAFGDMTGDVKAGLDTLATSWGQANQVLSRFGHASLLAELDLLVRFPGSSKEFEDGRMILNPWAPGPIPLGAIELTHTLVHEAGHRLWFQTLSEDQRKGWDAGWRMLKRGLIPGGKLVSDYAGDNSMEDFAEVFAYLAQGRPVPEINRERWEALKVPNQTAKQGSKNPRYIPVHFPGGRTKPIKLPECPDEVYLWVGAGDPTTDTRYEIKTNIQPEDYIHDWTWIAGNFRYHGVGSHGTDPFWVILKYGTAPDFYLTKPCVECGQEMPDFAKFCPVCGAEQEQSNKKSAYNLDGGMKPQSPQERIASRWLEATKTPYEKEEEQTEALIKPHPKKKPPRNDLKNHIVKEKDPDIEKPGADNDKDLSKNYKRIASPRRL